MSRLDDLQGPTDAELRQSESRGAAIAKGNRRIAQLRALPTRTPREEQELDDLLDAARRPE